MKYKTRKLTVELLKNTLFYDEEKNQFIWRYTQGANARMGTVAGYNRAKDGKRYINLFRIAYPFAILVHFYKTGEWLEGIAPGTSLDEIKRLTNKSEIKRPTNKSEKELKKVKKVKKQDRHQSVRIWKTTLSKLRLLSGATEISMTKIMDDLVEEALRQLKAKNQDQLLGL